MTNVLLVSSTDKGTEVLSALLRLAGFQDITTAKSGNLARRMMIQGSFDLALINAPLQDEFGDELSMEITQNSTSGVLLIVKNDIAESVSEKVERCGVLVVSKPLRKHIFYQALRLVEASRIRILGLKDENIRLKNKIEEIRLVNRAKCVLIQYLNMTEPQAHRYIEKQAMDMRISRREVALNVLKVYES